MGRLTKAKIDEIRKLRQQGYTQRETAEKAKIHLRTVRKYDPLREQKPARPGAGQIKAIEESCIKLAAAGLAQEESGGRFRITSLGKRTYEKFEELGKRAILRFMAEADRPVTEEETGRYIERVSDQLFYQAIDEAKNR